jgi:AcrR family transcriptional regulator
MKSTDLQLDADAIVEAAIDILQEHGLDAVSMRSVSARLGVSPIPLYSRVGNKEALLDAVADKLLADLAPATMADEAWPEYAARWATALRGRIKAARDSRLILGQRRSAYVAASRPLIALMRKAGLSSDAAVQGCRLLMWATIGFVVTEQHGRNLPPRRGRRRLSGSDPAGVTPEDADELFALHIRYLIDGIDRTAKGLIA